MELSSNKFSLKEKYGHEENFSKAIAESITFSSLLEKCGAKITEDPSFEKRVDKGHEGHEGRIDIVQPTSAGIVIVEVQYGRSDNNHARRLENYAANYRKPAFVIWVAESFRTEHKNIFQHSKTPVLCARASLSDNNLVLKQASPITWTKQTQSKRVQESNKKCKELMERLFSEKFVEYKSIESFFQDKKSKRHNNLKTVYDEINEPRVKGWDFEGLVESIIDYYFFGLPKKTKYFVLKHSAFLEYKNDLKNKLKEYWEETNKDNDHPYVDYTFLKKSEREKFKKHSHKSRLNKEGEVPIYDGNWDKEMVDLHKEIGYFAHQKYYKDWHPLVKNLWGPRWKEVLKATKKEHLSGFKNKDNSIISYDKKLQNDGDKMMASIFGVDSAIWKSLEYQKQKEACLWYKKNIKIRKKELEQIRYDLDWEYTPEKQKEYEDKISFHELKFSNYINDLLGLDKNSNRIKTTDLNKKESFSKSIQTSKEIIVEEKNNSTKDKQVFRKKIKNFFQKISLRKNRS